MVVRFYLKMPFIGPLLALHPGVTCHVIEETEVAAPMISASFVTFLQALCFTLARAIRKVLTNKVKNSVRMHPLFL